MDVSHQIQLSQRLLLLFISFKPFGSLIIHIKHEQVTSSTKMENGQLHFKDIYRYYTVPFCFALTMTARV